MLPLVLAFVLTDRGVDCAFKWLNRRGGKRKSFTWPVFTRAFAKLGIAKPRITERSYARRVFA